MEGLSACECPVCFLLLNHNTHQPMSMPCGHTLCKVTMVTQIRVPVFLYLCVFIPSLCVGVCGAVRRQSHPHSQ